MVYATKKADQVIVYNGMQFNIAGGTWASIKTPKGIMPADSSEMIFRQYLADIAERPDVRIVPLMNVDSTDMHFQEYDQIARAMISGVREGYPQLDAQGTDSIDYGGAFFSLRLPFKMYPVVLVGSMIEAIKGKSSDAPANINAAIAVAERGWPGTYIAMNEGEIFRATRAVKMRPNKKVERRRGRVSVPDTHAFVSVNYPLVARFSDGEIRYTKRGERAQEAFLRKSAERSEFFQEALGGIEWPLYLDQYTRVYVLDLHQNFEPDELDQAYRDGYRAAVIKARGTGGVFNTPKEKALVPKIERWRKGGRFMAITSRVPEASVEPTYEVNRRSAKAGAVLCYDMTSEVVIAKAELAGAIADSPLDFKRVMLYNFEEEIDTELVPPRDRTTDDRLLEVLEKATKNGRMNNGGPELPLAASLAKGLHLF